MKTRNKLMIFSAVFLLAGCATSSTKEPARSGWFSGLFNRTNLPQVQYKGAPDTVSSTQPTDYYKMTPSLDD
jgi:hypothetical protein